MLCHLNGILGIDCLLIHSSLGKPHASPIFKVNCRDDDHFFSSSSVAPGSLLNASSMPTLTSSSAVSHWAFLLKKEPILKRFSLSGLWVSSILPLHTSTPSFNRMRWRSNPTEAGRPTP